MLNVDKIEAAVTNETGVCMGAHKIENMGCVNIRPLFELTP